MRSYFLWVAKLLSFIFIVFFLAPIVFLTAIASVISMGEGKAELGAKKVAVVTIDGVIENSKDTLTSLYKLSEDDQIEGIVLRINSPGGAVGPSQDIYAAVKKLREKKPIIASMGTVAASGGFYAALGASKILCQPGTITGSIGVILQLPNVKAVSEKVGFEMVTVKSGALKDVGNLFREMEPYEREFLQQTVSEVHEEFVQAVTDSRPVDKEKIKEFTDGRMILGSQAVELKLADGYGDVYDAARAVFDVLGKPLPPGEYPKVIFDDDKLASFRKFLESVSNIPSVFSTGAISRRAFTFEYSM